jgi:hypothetical protein
MKLGCPENKKNFTLMMIGHYKNLAKLDENK